MGSKLDHLNYEELVTELRGLPLTWLPTLICEMVRAAYERKAFVNGGASRLVVSVEKKIGKSEPTEKESHE